MKIMHNIGLSVGAEERRAFLAVGVELPMGIASVDIDESDPRWPAIQTLWRQIKAVDMVRTKFSSGELKQAACLAMVPTWHHGYPQPSEDNGFLAATYDLSDYCAACGIGKRQTQPFRFAAAPVWGKNSVLQLNWIFDKYFVKPEVWSMLFKPVSIGCRPVLLHPEKL